MRVRCAVCVCVSIDQAHRWNGQRSEITYRVFINTQVTLTTLTRPPDPSPSLSLSRRTAPHRTAVGFQVPLKQFWSWKVIGHGSFFFLAVLGKFAMGFFADPLTSQNFFTVGLAMSTWGEFAFIIAVGAKNSNLIDDDTFASCILAVLMSCLISPFALRYAITHFHNKTKSVMLQAALNSDASKGGLVFYKLDIRVSNKWGVLSDLIHSFPGMYSMCVFAQ